VLFFVGSVYIAYSNQKFRVGHGELTAKIEIGGRRSMGKRGEAFRITPLSSPYRFLTV
jgi:hypothetical protein